MSQNLHELHKPEYEGSRKPSAQFIRAFLTTVCAALGCVVGFGLGWFAIVACAHGGPGWPVIVICGPVALAVNLFHGGEVNNGIFILGGTAVLYALYASLAVSKQTRRILTTLFAVHVISALACVLFY